MLLRYQPPFGDNYPFSNSGSMFDFQSMLSKAFDEGKYFDFTEFDSFDITFLIDYIERTHKLYLNKSLQEIEQTVNLLNRAYPSGHELLEILNRFYVDYKTETIEHIKEEDELLLPHIKSLLSISVSPVNHERFFKLYRSFNISDFLNNHHDDHHSLDSVINVVKSYAPPATNRFLHGVLINQLNNFECDLFIHGNIEEKVLIPKAMALEANVLARYERLVSLN